jgi:ABC-type transport system involved in multi-copper enzyme maturation permease subunit
MRTIAGAVALIAPGLTAASIVGEKQRKSFDLVFSAPVTPKYFLVGKMLGSYRYTIMLLVLSLPVIALSALLGGATWSDILICYFMMSTAGLIFTAIALLVSAMHEKVHAAIAASYLLVGIYLILTLTIAGSFAMRSAFSGGGPIGEAPFLATLNPFLIPESYGTYTTIGATKVPNWIWNGVYTIAVVRLALLGAGSAMGSIGAPETKGLRIQGLLYLLGFTLLMVYLPATGTRSTGAGTFVTLVTSVIVLAMPWISSFGESGRRITNYDGGWNWKRVFLGTPSGAGPYILAMFVAIALGGLWVANHNGIAMMSLAAHLVHGIGVTVFFAGMARWMSAKMGFAKGRSLASTLTVLAIWVMPLFVLISAANVVGHGTRFDQYAMWLLWPMWPIVADFSFYALYIYGVLFGLAGAVMWWGAENRAPIVRNS